MKRWCITVAELILKNGIYDRIGSNYFTPEPHAHNISIDLDIEVYTISYDWGLMGVDSIQEFVEPYYTGNLRGKITSANFTLDSTSDMRTTGSFSIIIDEDSPFMIHCRDSIFWSHVWFRIIKKYQYNNDIDMYPMYDWGDHIGLWNNNGLVASDPSQSIIGWFAPNNGGYNFNEETRELSLSCTDIMSFYTETQGGHLRFAMENLSGLNYRIYGSVPIEAASDFAQDKERVADYSSGVLIEGDKRLKKQDLQYDNYFLYVNDGKVSPKEEHNAEAEAMDEIDCTPKVSPLWKESYVQYNNAHKDDKEEEIEASVNFNISVRGASKNTLISKLLTNIVADFGTMIPITSLYVDLQNDSSPLPYDLEFNGDTTLYDVLKKIVDLYPRQTIFFDVNRRLNLCQQARVWAETTRNDVEFRAREFSDLVLEEKWNVNTDNIKNFTVLWGRDESCVGYYYMSGVRSACLVCGHISESFSYTPYCLNPRCRAKAARRLHGTYECYSVPQIGARKQVIYDDNVTTEQEAFNTAKWLTIEKCRAIKTLTVTMTDRYLSMYQSPDKSIGKRIEYKSKLTGETDVYTVLKWTNDFNSGTITMELEPFYSCEDEYITTFNGKYSCLYLPMPTFECSVDENGLLTMIINNGWHTAYSLFKVYCAETSLPLGSDATLNYAISPQTFIGETCEVYTEETETDCQTKVFRYQFKKGGRYTITCEAWNPNYSSFGCADAKIIEVKLNNDKYISIDNKYFVSEDNEYYIP